MEIQHTVDGKKLHGKVHLINFWDGRLGFDYCPQNAKQIRVVFNKGLIMTLDGTVVGLVTLSHGKKWAVMKDEEILIKAGVLVIPEEN